MKHYEKYYGKTINNLHIILMMFNRVQSRKKIIKIRIKYFKNKQIKRQRKICENLL